jgi:predicted permease
MTVRRREIQVRAALGASRSRLFRQVVSEHAVMGLAGAAAGVAVAWILVALSRALLPEAFLLRTLHPVDLDVRALIVAAAVGIAATIAAGLLPAWIGTRTDTSLALDSGRAATQSKAARRVTSGLLISEVAVACALLVGAALLVRSFVKLSAADRGLRTEGVMTAWVSLPPRAYPNRAVRVVADDELESAIRSLPGVSRVALSFGIPPAGGSIHSFDNWIGDDPGSRPQALEVDSYNVGHEFFDLYGIPILQGRTFSSDDADGKAILGERLAKLLWPGHTPVGRQFSFGTQHYEVIGVAREISFPSLDAGRDLPEFYEQFKGGGTFVSVSMNCAARCPGEAEIRLAIARVAPRATVTQVGAAATTYLEELARPRATAALATVFGVVAALAVAGGLFSVLTFAVAARQREFGIRAAIGASPRALRTVVYSEAARVGGVGLVLGSGMAIAVAYAIRALVYGVTPWDPRSWAPVLVLLVATMAIACWRPARTAANADPVTLLRTE